MAWNGKKKCYECDRCGKSIGYSTANQTLCKECNKWLKEYMSRYYAEKTQLTEA